MVTKQDLRKYKLWEIAKHHRENPTPTEALMWEHIKHRIHPCLPVGWFFRRQYVFKTDYILDFYCQKAKLNIEVDGSSHINQEIRDLNRDSRLNCFGIKVVRIKSYTVYTPEIAKICEAIIKKCLTCAKP